MPGVEIQPGSRLVCLVEFDQGLPPEHPPLFPNGSQPLRALCEERWSVWYEVRWHPKQLAFAASRCLAPSETSAPHWRHPPRNDFPPYSGQSSPDHAVSWLLPTTRHPEYVQRFLKAIRRIASLVCRSCHGWRILLTQRLTLVRWEE